MIKIFDFKGNSYDPEEFRARVTASQEHQDAIRSYVSQKEQAFLEAEKGDSTSTEELKELLVAAVYSSNVLDHPYELSQEASEKILDKLHVQRRKPVKSRALTVYNYEYDLSKVIQLGLIKSPAKKEKGRFVSYFNNLHPDLCFNRIKLLSRARILGVEYPVDQEMKLKLQTSLDGFIRNTAYEKRKEVVNLKRYLKNKERTHSIEDLENDALRKIVDKDLGLLTAAQRSGLTVTLPLATLENFIGFHLSDKKTDNEGFLLYNYHHLNDLLFKDSEPFGIETNLAEELIRIFTDDSIFPEEEYDEEPTVDTKVNVNA